MHAARIAQIRRIRKRAAERGKPSGPGEVIELCDAILEMHAENRQWDRRWRDNLRREVRSKKTSVEDRECRRIVEELASGKFQVIGPDSVSKKARRALGLPEEL